MKTLFTLVLLIGCSVIKAQNPLILGGSIRYDALGNNQYKIIATINRSCEGEALTSLPSISVFSGNNNFSVPCVRTAINNISTYCPSAQPCNIANAISNPGLEQHVYEAQIDFNSSTYAVFKTVGNCMVYFGLSSSKRSDSISNISTNNFYAEAMINLCALGNSLSNTSPKQALIKNIDVAQNAPFIFVHDGIDLTDNDVLDFELIAPLSAHQTKETYTGNLSDTIPMTPFCPPNFEVVNCRPLPNAKPPRGFFYDKKSGKLYITPTRKEVAALCVRMNEYRDINGSLELIGYSSDEFVFNVRPFFNNNPPSITGINRFNLCEGDSINFQVTTNDDISFPNQTVADTTSLAWNYGIPGSHITTVNPTAREKTYNFKWKTKIGDGKKEPYRFVIQVKDNQCPSSAYVYRDYEILVSPKPNVSIANRIEQVNTLYLVSTGADTNDEYRYKWSVRNSNDSLLYVSFNEKDSILLPKAGQYFIDLLVNNQPNNCSSQFYDTIQVNYNLNVAQHHLNKQIRVYPNPVQNTLYIQSADAIESIQIVDNYGKQVLKTDFVKEIDVERLASGSYFIRFKWKEGVYNYHFIKN
jgi:hypothetical protein